MGKSSCKSEGTYACDPQAPQNKQLFSNSMIYTTTQTKFGTGEVPLTKNRTLSARVRADVSSEL